MARQSRHGKDTTSTRHSSADGNNTERHGNSTAKPGKDTTSTSIKYCCVHRERPARPHGLLSAVRQTTSGRRHPHSEHIYIYIYICGKRGGNFSDTSQTHATTLRTKAVGTRTEHCTHVPLLARQQHSNARQEHGLAWAWQVRLETRRAKCTCIATPRPMLGMPAAREQARTLKHVA